MRNPKSKIQMAKRRFESGQSLVEVIVAVGLILTAVVALLTLATSSMKSSGFGAAKARATKLANEEMELVRAYRDEFGWSVFSSATGVPTCLDPAAPCHIEVNPITSVMTMRSGNDVAVLPFARSFVVVPPGVAVDQSTYTIAVRVTWTDQSGDHTVEISSVLADWQ